MTSDNRTFVSHNTIQHDNGKFGCKTDWRQYTSNLFSHISEEFKSLTIREVISQYRNYLNEFLTISKNYRKESSKYNKLLMVFIEKIGYLFDAAPEPTSVYVRSNLYSVDDWGRVYWLFLHYCSILLTYAREKKMIDDVLGFPTIVRNIDCILPCPLCREHYRIIKNNEAMMAIIKNMAFGDLMSGLMKFHIMVTKNISDTQIPKPPQKLHFTLANFAEQFGCVELIDPSEKKTITYTSNLVDWQSKTHTYMCVVLSYIEIPYLLSSNLIKMKLYARQSQFSLLDHVFNKYQLKYCNYMSNTGSSGLIVDLCADISGDRVFSKFVTNLLFQQQTSESPQNMDFFLTASLFIEAVLYFYEKYPNIILESMKYFPEMKEIHTEDYYKSISQTVAHTSGGYSLMDYEKDVTKLKNKPKLFIRKIVQMFMINLILNKNEKASRQQIRWLMQVAKYWTDESV